MNNISEPGPQNHTAPISYCAYLSCRWVATAVFALIQEQTSVKFQSKYKCFHSWKCIWKYLLWNGIHFVRGGWVNHSLQGATGDFGGVLQMIFWKSLKKTVLIHVLEPPFRDRKSLGTRPTQVKPRLTPKLVNHIRPQLSRLCGKSSWTPTSQNVDEAPQHWRFQRYDILTHGTNTQMCLGFYEGNTCGLS